MGAKQTHFYAKIFNSFTFRDRTLPDPKLISGFQPLWLLFLSVMTHFSALCGSPKNIAFSESPFFVDSRKINNPPIGGLIIRHFIDFTDSTSTNPIQQYQSSASQVELQWRSVFR